MPATSVGSSIPSTRISNRLLMTSFQRVRRPWLSSRGAIRLPGSVLEHGDVNLVEGVVYVCLRRNDRSVMCHFVARRSSLTSYTHCICLFGHLIAANVLSWTLTFRCGTRKMAGRSRLVEHRTWKRHPG